MSPQSPNDKLRGMLRVVAIFAALLLAGSALIFFGTRNDATTVAKTLKAGVLTADEVNVAFENVGGRLVKRDIEESQRVKKGDVLMVIDDTDTAIAIRRQKAVIAGEEAALAHEIAAIAIATDETNLAEKTSWRTIEEIEAGLVAARASLELAKSEFKRAENLVKSGSVSRSVYDAALSALTNARSAVRESERRLASSTIGAAAHELAALAKTGSAEGMTLSAVQNARETIRNRENTVANLRAMLEEARADLRQLEVNEKRLTLTAPEDGKILKILYENGEIVSANAPAVLLETDRRYFDIYVNETMAPDFKEGTRVRANVPALGKAVSGTVRFATAAPSFADLRMVRERGQADLTNFQVRVYIDRDPEVLTGMTLEVAN